ncbi:amino acid ABC transporter permease [Dactylosporangium sp. NPDC005572]|uniref:amino acid ABC transporter permease n=1 Tax=Dactylosporangium sp. NPDC005572 TaxID=3156889 RepID=UPI0033B064B2
MPTGAGVFYDAPGPRARRTVRLTSAVATVAVLAAAWWLVIRPLRDQGQFSMELWGPIVDPSNPSFSALWRRFGQGIGATLQAAALSITTSALCGAGLAVLRVQLKQLARRQYPGMPAAVAWILRGLGWTLNAVTRVCVDVFRGMPVVITIFFVGRALPEFGLRFDNVLWYLVIGLTAYNMVVLAETLRSGMEGLPKGQREAAASLGLSSLQTTILVLLPQAIRIMLPALIGQLIVVLKDTSLGFIISYEELLNVAKTATQVLSNPIQMYFLVGLVYLAMNYALSRLADWTQRRVSRPRRS